MSAAEASRKSDVMKKAWHERERSNRAWQGMKRTRDRLTVTGYRPSIIDAVDQSQVTLLVGETGCGKTTQVRVNRFIGYMWDPAFVVFSTEIDTGGG